MKVGIYGDVHLTKNMRTMQSLWEDSAKKSIIEMYKTFDKDKVDMVVCLGDFFDKPVIEAKSLHLVLPILNWMNTRDYPTYLLLGNHEIDDDEHNILEYLSEYENIKPVTDVDIVREKLLFIPYSIPLEGVDAETIKDRFVFTHHDIYGSELAGGQTKAFFGADPSLLKDSKGVFNGHVHLRSRVSSNILNTGSLLISQQGELEVGNYPRYYVLDSDSESITEYDNVYSMIYLAINQEQVSSVDQYAPDRLVLRVDYVGDIPETFIDAAHTSWRKKISSISSETVNVVRTSNFDLKSYLSEYIRKDSTISDDKKEEYVKLGLEILDS